MPKNRWSEDGRIPQRYAGLTETATEDPAERTELNVIASDVVLLVTDGELAGGSLLTRECAEKLRKPLMHVDFSVATLERTVERGKKWLASIDGNVLNVAGPRASESAEIYEKTIELLQKLFCE